MLSLIAPLPHVQAIVLAPGAPNAARMGSMSSRCALPPQACATEDEDDSIAGEEVEIELQRLRLQSRAMEDRLCDEPDLTDADAWAEEVRLLGARAEKAELAAKKAEKERRTSLINVAGGLLWGGAVVGGQYCVKEGIVPAEGALAALALGFPLLSWTGLLGNWRGEDVEWRAQRKREREREAERKRREGPS